MNLTNSDPFKDFVVIKNYNNKFKCFILAAYFAVNAHLMILIQLFVSTTIHALHLVRAVSVIN